MTYVCITGNESDPRALQDRIDRVLRQHARLLCELRLDFLDLSPGAVFSFLAKLPSEWAPRLVLTQRLRASGVTAQGRCGWDLPTWQSWWKDVMSLRPWFAVDLDWIVLDRLGGEGLSWQGKFSGRHAFFSLHSSLDDLESLASEFAASARVHGAGVKIAAPVAGPRDFMRLLKLSDGLGDFPLKTIVAMGPAGKSWRWSPLAGNLTYFAVDEASITAQGQDLLMNVLPYLQHRRRPDLFLLWSNDPENRKGETRWNELFRQRGMHARYLNVPCSDVPTAESDEALWAKDALEWMERAGVSGASITRPFKRIFADAVGGSGAAVNTIQFKDGRWRAQNTDGEAVAAIMADHGLAKEPVAILGGGGAAQAVQAYLEARGVSVAVLRRNEAGEPPETFGERKILISTWPGHNQQLLVEWLKRCAPKSLSLCIDAQFSVPEAEAPLAEWCSANGIRYVPGTEWWRRQALGQDCFWFSSEERWGRLLPEILRMAPRSKSITLRALAIAAIRNGKTIVHNPSLCEDTAVFRSALEKLGLRISEDGDGWIVTPPLRLKASSEVLTFGEGATGFRIFLGLTSEIQGERLKVDAAESLRSRPHDEIFSYLNVDQAKWPLEIKLPVSRPAQISAQRSSQFATSLLISAAAESKRTGNGTSLKVLAGGLSQSYLLLTKRMLEAAGFTIKQDGDIWEIAATSILGRWETDSEIDASGFAFLQVIAAKLRLDLPFHSEVQGDAVFAELLQKLINGGRRFSLPNHPDLAAPLVAAALLFHRDLEICDCPQLRFKESNRIRALVELAKGFGVTTEERTDGMVIAGSEFILPAQLVTVKTFDDHRIAMAAGVIGFFSPLVKPDNPNCVAKSFPDFWQVLRLFQEARP